MQTNRKHLLYLDNLKIVLITIVVFCHASGSYLANEYWWWHQSTTITSQYNKFIVLIAMGLMGAFFMISGYFTPASYNQNGSANFFKKRLKRFGIPILFGFIIIFPILLYAYYLNFRNLGDISFTQYYIKYYMGFSQMPIDWSGPGWPDAQFGHLWYLQHLLLYSGGYILFKKLFKRDRKQRLEVPGFLHITFAIVILSFFTFLIRIPHPAYSEKSWGAIFWLIQTPMSDFPLHVSCFFIGVLAYRNDWLSRFSSKNGFIWFGLYIVLSLLFIIFVEYFSDQKFHGGISWEAFVYSIITNFIGISFCICMIILFRNMFNKTTCFFSWLAQNTYTVYVIHLPLVVLIQYQIESYNFPIILKLSIVFVLSLFISFLLSPYIRRVNILRDCLGR